MGDVIFYNLDEYTESVIDMIESLENITLDESVRLAEANREQILYGFKNRISALVVAASILGISNCCMPAYR